MRQDLRPPKVCVGFFVGLGWGYVPRKLWKLRAPGHFFQDFSWGISSDRSFSLSWGSFFQLSVCFFVVVVLALVFSFTSYADDGKRYWIKPNSPNFLQRSQFSVQRLFMAICLCRFEKSSAMAANSDAVLEDLQQFVVCIVRKACRWGILLV